MGNLGDLYVSGSRAAAASVKTNKYQVSSLSSAAVNDNTNVIDDFSDPAKSTSSWYKWGNTTLDFPGDYMVFKGTDSYVGCGIVVGKDIYPGPACNFQVRVKGTLPDSDPGADLPRLRIEIYEKTEGGSPTLTQELTPDQIPSGASYLVNIPVANKITCGRIQILILGYSADFNLQIDDVQFIDVSMPPAEGLKAYTIPNPIKSGNAVRFKFNVPSTAGTATVKAFNIAGMEVKTLDTEDVSRYAQANADAMVSWDGKVNGVSLAPGTYFFQVSFDNGVPLTGAFTVIK
jgi:hypothetical protein